MGMARQEAYTLLLQGDHVLEFINGLSTNLVTGSCTTVITNRAAQIVDVCDVIPVCRRQRGFGGFSSTKGPTHQTFERSDSRPTHRHQ